MKLLKKFNKLMDRVLIMKDGLPKIYKLIRGRRNSLKELIKSVLENLKNKMNFELAFVHGKDHFTKLIGSALGVHAGPGSLGVAINTLEEDV